MRQYLRRIPRIPAAAFMAVCIAGTAESGFFSWITWQGNLLSGVFQAFCGIAYAILACLFWRQYRKS